MADTSKWDQEENPWSLPTKIIVGVVTEIVLGVAWLSEQVSRLFGCKGKAGS